MPLITQLTLLLQLAVGHAPAASTSAPRLTALQAVETRPTLAFPEAGLDDPAAYQGYQTRLYRDGARNTVQLYIDQRAARVVHVWADAENESIGFTARGRGGDVAPLRWNSAGARMTGDGASRTRTIEYRLIADSPIVNLGWFLLGSMRVERDFQYEERQRKGFGNQIYQLPEFNRLLTALGGLDAGTQRQQLTFLHAPDVATLTRRLQPTATVAATSANWVMRLVQPTLDGLDTLSLEITVDPKVIDASRAADSVTFTAKKGSTVPFTVRISTTGQPLHPLSRSEIFTPAFLRFLSETRAAAADSNSVDGLKGRRLERQVRGVELLASREKLMAGLPTYATYFGRDMLVSALMMRPIWRGTMAEAVIAAALRKLSPTGQVSHEEALGGQAVREAATEYVHLLAARDSAIGRGNRGLGDSLLARASTVLRTARRTRENYHMIDDEFQLPVMVSRWITDPTIATAQKRAFLLADGGSGVPRLTLLARELGLVAQMTAAYTAKADATNLISFERGEPTGWSTASWRDSGAGYGGGRYAMDVNTIWAPQALESMVLISKALKSMGLSLSTVASRDSLLKSNGAAKSLFTDSGALNHAASVWRDASKHFLITRSPAEITGAIATRLAAMPAEERTFWNSRTTSTGADKDSLTFLALALDSAARPVAVANTDPGTRLFLGEHEGQPVSTTTEDMARTVRDVRLFVRPYPAGLLVEGVGPAVSNDAYSTPAVWNLFVKDAYHGPRVVWGREVNLFLLGAASHVQSVKATAPAAQQAYARELDVAIATVRRAVTASGFHSELWSYGFTNGTLSPMRYGSGADVQLWSTTDLAVAFALDRKKKSR